MKVLAIFTIIGLLFSILNYVNYFALESQFGSSLKAYIFVGIVLSLLEIWPCVIYMKWLLNDQVATRNELPKAQIIMAIAVLIINLWNIAGPFLTFGDVPVAS
jgi:hypothetical protein